MYLICKKKMENNTILSKKLMLVNGLLLAGIVGVAFQIYSASSVPLLPESDPEIATVSHQFDALNLEAKSVYVLDVLGNKVMYKKNELAQLPLASLTKLLTALVATEILPKESHITVRKEFLEEIVDNGLLPDDES